MKNFKEDRLQKKLAAAYFEKENIKVGQRWHEEVMSHIRGLTPGVLESNDPSLFNQVVRRFAVAACFFAVILFAYAIQAGLNLEYEVAEVFIENPAEFDLARIFGLN